LVLQEKGEKYSKLGGAEEGQVVLAQSKICTSVSVS
jgi:hypothetical protein